MKKFLIITMCVLVLTFFVCTAFSPQISQAETIYWDCHYKFSFPENIYIDSGMELRVLFMNGIGDTEIWILDDMDTNRVDGRYVYDIVSELDFFADDVFYVYVMVEQSNVNGLPYYGLSRVFADAGLGDGSRTPIYGTRYTNGYVFNTSLIEDFAFIQFDFERLESGQQIADLQNQINVLEQEKAELNDKLAQALEDLADYGVADQSLNFIEKAFRSVGNIFKIEILPGIRIGTFFIVPLLLGVVFLILRLVRGE